MEDIKIKSILMPTDFSELSGRALKIAIEICLRHNAKLSLLYVIDGFIYAPNSSDILMPYYYQSNEEFNKVMEDNLNKLASVISSQNKIEVESIVAKGNPAEMICIKAYEGLHDMIVMGTHGISGIREFFIGSNAYKVVKHSPCPVLTIPGKWDKTDFNKIVFPIRLIPGAIDKYEHARPIIKKNNSSLLIVGLVKDELPDTMAEFKMEADRLIFKLKADNIQFSTIVIHSKHFAGMLLDAVESFDADLVVVTATLDFEWKNIFIGPYVQQIVNHSKRPVLSIKPEVNIKEMIESSEMENKLASEKFSGQILLDF